MTVARVLLTTDVVGGVWDFSLVLARELVGRGTHVVLLALGEPAADQRRRARQTGAELITEPLRLEWMQDSQADVAETQQVLDRLVQQFRPDVVHANQFATACVAAPVVLTLHSDVLSWRKWTLGSTGVPVEWAPYCDLVRQALARADAVVAVSEFLAREMRTLYGTAREIDVIPDGWPPAAESPGPRSKQTLVAGRIWDAAKNVRLALEARPPGARVLLAGEQRHPETGGLADVPDGVEQLGFVPRGQLDRLLGQTRVYLSAARYDPFGLLPLQAALNGCALLLSDIPSYREVWGDSGVFFEPDELRAKWQNLLEDDAACAHKAQQARQRALERYSPRKMADSYLALYARVMAGVAV